MIIAAENLLFCYWVSYHFQMYTAHGNRLSIFVHRKDAEGGKGFY